MPNQHPCINPWDITKNLEKSHNVKKKERKQIPWSLTNKQTDAQGWKHNLPGEGTVTTMAHIHENFKL